MCVFRMCTCLLYILRSHAVEKKAHTKKSNHTRHAESQNLKTHMAFSKRCGWCSAELPAVVNDAGGHLRPLTPA